MKLRMPPYDAILVAIIEDYLDQNWQTQVVAVSTHGTDTDLQTVYHRGHTTKTYSRPIFELFTDGAGSTLPGPGTPCGCGDFSRSWACELHEETALGPEAAALDPAASPGAALRLRGVPSGRGGAERAAGRTGTPQHHLQADLRRRAGRHPEQRRARSGIRQLGGGTA